MRDIFDKLHERMGPLGQHADNAHGYYTFPKLEGPIGPRMIFRGKERLNWSLNNYLGLANHPDVMKADTDAAAQFGMAYPMGARMMSGNSNYHEQLERDLASFVQKPDCILLNYGYQGVLSAIDALVDRHDVIVYDAESHACIIDGVRLHMGKRFVYNHNNIESLEQQLRRATKVVEATGGAILVITEGVFGMTGSQGKLKEIVELKANSISAFSLTMRMVSERWEKRVRVLRKSKALPRALIFISQLSPNQWRVLGPLSLLNHTSLNSYVTICVLKSMQRRCRCRW